MASPLTSEPRRARSRARSQLRAHADAGACAQPARRHTAEHELSPSEPALPAAVAEQRVDAEPRAVPDAEAGLDDAHRPDGVRRLLALDDGRDPIEGGRARDVARIHEDREA